jgi:hypothetical protein
MACMTLVHTLTNHPVSQFGYSNPENADTLENRVTHCFFTRYVVKKYLYRYPLLQERRSRHHVFV